MIIFPAIDIKDGKVVRLTQGQFDKVTVYSDDPVSVAKKWIDEGAQWLHVVDLDGAQKGEPVNTETIIRIAQTVDVPVQTGGGIRTKEDITQLLDAGVQRVILGTKSVDDELFLIEVLDQWSDNIAVSLDCKDGMVAHQGWTEVTDKPAIEFAIPLEGMGLKWLIYTDIKRDGMLHGPNTEGISALCDMINIPVIAAGGIATLDDIHKLKTIESNGLAGIITGKAIYEGSLNLREAIRACSQKE